LAETTAIPIVVLSRHQDAGELINSTLRNAGHAVHCTWVRELGRLGDTLAQTHPRLMFACLADGEDAAPVIDVRDRQASSVPIILVRNSLTEDDLTTAIVRGARDVVTLRSKPRLTAVAERELHLASLDGTLAGTLASARQYRDQMRAFMTGSTDAIAHVQEGIVVDANPAWLELFGLSDVAAVVSQPLMDFFDPHGHGPLKGALVATLQGRWPGNALKVDALQPDGTPTPLEIDLERFEFDGEPAVRLKVATQRRDMETLAQQLEEAVRRDAATGLLSRSVFLEIAADRVTQSLKAGRRAILYLEIDKQDKLERELGLLAVEEIADAAGVLLQGLLQPDDLGGRITSRGYAVLLERGNARDLDAWGAGIARRLAAQVIQTTGRSISVTGSVGIALFTSTTDNLAAKLAFAVKCQRTAADAGGNRSLRLEEVKQQPSEAEIDRTWAARIKSALMANRFRLVQQPIASLTGEERAMFDLVVRMLDDKGAEVLPTEFLAAAERTDLLKNIDRWVVGAAMSFCAARKPHRVFVRLSSDSLRDATLGVWLQQQIRASRIEPERVVIEVSEENATRYIKEAKALQGALQTQGLGLAIENFGAGRDPLNLLNHVPVNYVKIDGSLMQGLANDRPLQERVKELVDRAHERKISTIAERVEDANTMAVLWQLGIEYIQGYFVNQPEEVVLESRAVPEV
jgi:EAL domain-containing protein (putative c-di-GMP-specific phosphodiesterase class I)/GGDEF domain-containing protein